LHLRNIVVGSNDNNIRKIVISVESINKFIVTIYIACALL